MYVATYIQQIQPIAKRALQNKLKEVLKKVTLSALFIRGKHSH
jgi:hypothetical protein